MFVVSKACIELDRQLGLLKSTALSLQVPVLRMLYPKVLLLVVKDRKPCLGLSFILENACPIGGGIPADDFVRRSESNRNILGIFLLGLIL